MPFRSRITDLGQLSARHGRAVQLSRSRTAWRIPVHPWPIRALALILSFLLSLSSSAPLMAITMGQIQAGVAGGSAGGGQGSAPNLQNAGAASAALTAALTKKSQQQSAIVVKAMQSLQAQAAAAAKANPATTLPSDSQGNPQTVNGEPTVYNGLKAGWLEPYVKDGGSGIVNGVAVTTSWSGASITPVDPAKNKAAAKDPNYVANPANYVNIQQTKQNAFLYWNKFNVGPQTTVNFDQSAGGQTAGNWIAFNKVMGASDPSHIFGNITAQGQVYVLNQNGILFHNGSTVNTHSLVASTLPINQNLAGDALDGVSGRGIANNPDAQFLFSSLAVPSGRNDKNGFDPSKTTYGVSASPGDVVVEKGAKIVSPVNDAGVGGLVALVGPNVRNDGSISTASGQTILASGLQVALLPHASKDPSLRGMDVIIGAVSDPGGIVTPQAGSAGSVINNGVISVPEGNATLAGRSISIGSLPDDPEIPVNGGLNVGGVIDSATSVALNGRIDLLASSGAIKNVLYGQQGPAYLQGSTGLINLDPGSVLRILPEWGSSSTVVGSSLALNSIVYLLGQSIHFGEGAVLEAPGAITTAGALSQNGDVLSSGVTLAAGQWFSSDPSSSSRLLSTEGQIYLESGSVIDVSGSSDVAVDPAQNYMTLQLRGSELANSPLQRNNLAIRAKDITVDGRVAGTSDGQILYFPTVADAYAAYLAGKVTWIGTPLGNAAGYAGLIQRGAGQLTEAGGSVSLSAGDSVVMQSGALINVSGGWSRYSGGNFTTTKLITTDGRTIDISQATPDQTYLGILKDPHQVDEIAYVNGAGGGSLSISAPAMALQGDLYGVTVTGARQLRSSPTTSMLPGLSSLNLSFQGTALFNNFAGVASPVTVSSPVAPTVIFSDAPSSTAPSFSIDSETGLPSALVGSLSPEVALSPSLVSSRGFGKLGITDHDGAVTVPSGVTLDFPALGSLTVNASLIDVSGSIIVPGGSVSLTANRVSTTLGNGLALIQDGVLQEPLLDVLVAKVDGNGLTAGEKVFRYGALPGDGSVNVIDPFNPNSSGDVSWNVPLDQLEPINTGAVTVAKGAVISTVGLVTDDSTLLSVNPYSASATIGGGTIGLNAYTISLAGGSKLDVSGGVIRSDSGALSYGRGGSLSLMAGLDPENSQMHGGSLQFDPSAGGLSGFGGIGKAAGSLKLGAPAFQIGGSSAPDGVTVLLPVFFHQGGFSSFSLVGAGMEDGNEGFVPGVLISSGTAIHPSVISQRVSPGAQDLALSLYQQPAGWAPAATLDFKATGVKDNLPAGQNLLVRGDLVLEQGASVTVDPQIVVNGSSAIGTGGSVTLSGMTASVQGSVIVPGGIISIMGASGLFPMNYGSLSDPEVDAAKVTVDLGQQALLSAAGKALLTPDLNGNLDLFGTVLAGGNITVAGNILAEAGSRLDASGASAMLDLPQSQTGRSGITRARVDSAGGSITLIGGVALYSDAVLKASAGGSSAAGGRLTLSSGRFYSYNDPQSASSQNGWDPSLAISQSLAATPSDLAATGTAAIGQALSPSFGIPEGGGNVSISTFANGGFDSIALKGSVQFVTGGEQLSITVPGTLRVGDKGVVTADGPVSLSAGYLAMGTAFLAPQTPDAQQPVGLPAPTTGSGNLTLSANLIDVGYLSLQGIDVAKFDAGSGVIRGDGVLDVAGDLTLCSSMIHPVSGVAFMINAYAGDASSGSIAVESGGGKPALPLSAAGSLQLYADTVVQGGVLAAPFGKIALGADAASAPVDPSTGQPVPTTTQLTLKDASITTVSGVDPVTGNSIIVPFGTSSDGTDWIDPSGTVITTTGIPSKKITLSAQGIVTEGSSKVVLDGGGSVVSTQWVSGLKGTINYLAEGSGSYAIIPGSQSTAAPTGYGDGSLSAGSQVYLSGITGLAAGYYTLLPAIYAAVLPGAYLLTPSSKNLSAGSFQNPDGSWLVSGAYRNGLDQAASIGTLRQAFRIDPPAVLAQKVQYQTSSADTFFSGIASSGRTKDGGHLVVQAGGSMTLGGAVSGKASGAGRASAIDITASSPIWIGTLAAQANAPEGDIVLTDSVLSSWNAGSLLVGGVRGSVAQDGTTPVTVTASSITVDDGTILKGQDIILAANESLAVGQGVTIQATGSGSAPDSRLSIAGDGLLMRVSSDALAGIVRSSVDPLQTQIAGLTDAQGNTYTPTLTIGGSTLFEAPGVILDATALSTIDSTATLKASTATINAGSIALLLNGAESPDNLDASDSASLVLQGGVLSSLQKSQVLSLGSYSSIDFYGVGGLQSPVLNNISLHAAELRGFDLSGGVVSLTSSGDLLVDNALAGTSPGAASASPNGGGLPDGSLQLGGSRILLGAGSVAIDQFASVILDASSGIYAKESGALGVGSQSMVSDLVLDAPLLTTLGAAPSFAIGSSGAFHLQNSSANLPDASSGGIGGRLALTAGNGMTLESSILLPSGSLSVEATTGNLVIGESSSATFSVAGATKTFHATLQTADAGAISLIAEGGDVILGSGASIDLSAQGASAGGSLTVSAPVGSLKLPVNPGSGEFMLKANASGGSNGGAGGTFSLDTMMINNPETVASGSPSLLSSIVPQLTAAGFTDSLTFRIRGGDVSVDTTVKAHSVSISADDPNQSFGTIEVTGNGFIDASGTTGGNIALQASGSVILDPGSSLSVHGVNYDAAGKGGSIFLGAGAEINGQINPNAVLDLQSGSTLDLGVSSPARVVGIDPNTGLPETDQFQGTLHLRSPVSFDESGNPTGIQIKAFDSTLASATHQVSGEDTVASVATLLGVSAVQLVLANNLVTTAPLQDGMTLRSSLFPDAQSYTVDVTNNGDTVDSVAAALGITPSQLTAYNNLPISLAAGSTLKSVNVSSIAVEGYRLYDLTTDGSSADPASVSSQAVGDAQAFLGSPGAYSDTASAIISRLGTRLSPAESILMNLAPGVEIINRQGDLTLSGDLDLSQFRTGANSAPGFLSLRASGNIILNASLSDGFVSSDYAATLLSRNGALPANFQSWSYSIAAGADLSSANLNAVLRGSTANLELGVPYSGGGPNILPNGDSRNPNGPDGLTSGALGGYYQVIRTGTGDIAINASGDLHLWNQFASIYTAGTPVLDVTLGGSFDTPVPDTSGQYEVGLGSPQQSSSSVQYSDGGGNLAINVSGNIQHLAWKGDGLGNVVTDDNGNPLVIADSVAQLPSNWLYRRGAVDPLTGQFLQMPNSGDLASTSWWVDFSNFFEGIGALGGGNIAMNAGGTIANVDAVIPTNFRMPGRDASGNAVKAGALVGVELGGGNLTVRSGGNLDAGVYYVEKGSGSILVGGSIITNPTRDPQTPQITGNIASLPESYLPTTLFVGQSGFRVSAAGQVTMGPVANVFLTPEGNNNGYRYQSYFSTYSGGSGVSISSLTGSVTLRDSAVTPGDSGSLLMLWYEQMVPPAGTSGRYNTYSSFYQPWNWLDVSGVTDLGPQLSLLPANLTAVSYGGSILLQGNLTLSPSSAGNLQLLAAKQIQGLVPSGSQDGSTPTWSSSSINVSDADPSKLPGITSPLSTIATLPTESQTDSSMYSYLAQSIVAGISTLVSETGSFAGANSALEKKLTLHDGSILHAGDTAPVELTALGGDISGMQLFSPKFAEISAAGSISDVGLYIQNVSASDISVVSAGGNIIPYDPTSPLQLNAYAATQRSAALQSGDIQISGPGTLEVIAGGNIDLGNGPNNADGTGVGIMSIGNSRNPSLGFEGANLITASGISLPQGLQDGVANAKSLIAKAKALPDAANYYKELLSQVDQEGDDDLADALKKAGSLDGIAGSTALSDDQKSRLAAALFYIVLRDSGRDHNNPDAASYGSYQDGRDAIASFLKGAGKGDISLRTQSIRTLNGGSISMLAPNGGVSLAGVIPPTLNALTPPGIVTEHGGAIDIYTRNDVSIGIGRIFTLRGGDIMIWSDQGNIAAGSSAKTVATAPPTRVIIDPQSGNVQTDLAGLATGGGIGVLDTVAGLPPGNVDLIAPSGIIDAGDAGIRSSGKLNLAATKVLNADNIAASSTSGAPAAVAASAPAVAPPSASTAAAANNASSETASKSNASSSEAEQTPSIFSIDVLGYGGGDGEKEDDQQKQAADTSLAPVQASL